MGLDVYSEEPPKNIDTFSDLNLISTPHIGASTSEAQLKAGLDTVENIKKITIFKKKLKLSKKKLRNLRL